MPIFRRQLHPASSSTPLLVPIVVSALYLPFYIFQQQKGSHSRLSEQSLIQRPLRRRAARGNCAVPRRNTISFCVRIHIGQACELATSACYNEFPGGGGDHQPLTLRTTFGRHPQCGRQGRLSTRSRNSPTNIGLPTIMLLQHVLESQTNLLILVSGKTLT